MKELKNYTDEELDAYLLEAEWNFTNKSPWAINSNHWFHVIQSIEEEKERRRNK